MAQADVFGIMEGAALKTGVRTTLGDKEPFAVFALGNTGFTQMPEALVWCM